MTVINGIDIDNIRYIPTNNSIRTIGAVLNLHRCKRNEIKDAIEMNDPLERKLHVVAVISNPCMFARRYILTREFIQRFEKDETNTILYVVELAYGKQSFLATDAKNPRHLQLRTETPVWHKENMINIGIRKLLPANWKAMAWIDADVEFENKTWAMDTLRILNGCKDIVQLFSHCVDMASNMTTMKVFNSAGYQLCKQLPFSTTGPNHWHPGYAWAITRKAYERLGGLYEKAILGSGDNIMLCSLLGNGLKAVSSESTDDYKDSIMAFQEKAEALRFGYVPGVISHYFHGSKINRHYGDRWKILLKHNYSPKLHIAYDANGLIVPTIAFPEELKKEILMYFASRNEDDP